MKKVFKIIFISLMMINLNACANMQSINLFKKKNELSMTKYNPIRFSERENIKFNVNRIEVVSKFSPSYTRPNVEHLSPVSVERTAKNWVKDRLLANNFTANEHLKFVINDASITEEFNKSASIFRKNTISYLAKINVTIQVVNKENMVVAETTTDAWRKATITEGTPITDKENLWYDLIENLFTQYDSKQTQTIDQYLNLYLQKSSLVKEYI